MNLQSLYHFLMLESTETIFAMDFNSDGLLTDLIGVFGQNALSSILPSSNLTDFDFGDRKPNLILFSQSFHLTSEVLEKTKTFIIIKDENHLEYITNRLESFLSLNSNLYFVVSDQLLVIEVYKIAMNPGKK